MNKINLKADVLRRKVTHEAWAVEAINEDGEGECYVAVFSGPKCQDRAVEYAEMAFREVLVHL